MIRIRCTWAGIDPLYCAYHDTEWGVPVHDDRKLYEFLVLEGFQAGLSWITILRKRKALGRAFARWDWNKVARFSGKDVKRLLADNGIIRNKLKIAAAINNARRFGEVIKEFGSFDAYIWKFTKNNTIARSLRQTDMKKIPCRTAVSDAMSADLASRGFKFVGSVICYSFMQAMGMVNDHSKGCWKAARKK
jgi:DNA-3-methyladenine glycosylase I